MATQHPDNACTPFWDSGDGFVAAHEEPAECIVCLRDLDADEFMWDWEGKHADEAVIDKLFSSYYDYFRSTLLGRDKFLTFRLPNVWKENGYSLIRALMVILTSEDFAHDLSFRTRPLFEVILPMTERADQLLYIQRSFRELARFKNRVFDHRRSGNNDYIEIIPLVEGVDDQIGIGTLLEEYVSMHRKFFGKDPAYIRPFLARSDPALVSGFVANVLANKIALSDIRDFSARHKIPTYPIIGAGALVFRGGLSPARAAQFAEEYAGVRTVTVQSAFRYDHPLAAVKRAIRFLRSMLPRRVARAVEERAALLEIIRIFSREYQAALAGLVADMQPIFAAVPKRRERRQHIGLLGYGRMMGKRALPRAITFVAAWYSIGVPPEFIGLGRALSKLDDAQLRLLRKHYRYIESDVREAGRYLNRENIASLAKRSRVWKGIVDDVRLAEARLLLRLGPKTTNDLLHCNLTSQALLRRRQPKELARLIAETGKLRRSLG